MCMFRKCPALMVIVLALVVYVVTACTRVVEPRESKSGARDGRGRQA